jgi:AmmeMemoRadiSam system protein B
MEVMVNALPRLRMNLDFMPSPVPDRPGLLIRDPYQYSEATLIVPPALVPCLQLLDGTTSELELREMLVRLTGDLQVGPLQDHLMQTLDAAGFLETEAYAELVELRRREFAEAPVREPSHSGPGGYPEEIDPLKATLTRWMDGQQNTNHRDSLVGVASPHVSPEGGWQSYRAAYSALRPESRDRTFVILGTSHYGAPEKFGLTRKPFVTPLGTTATNLRLVDELASKADTGVTMEDYCHAIEHSIEFQVVFLQHVYGPDVRILPILCGSFAKSIYEGGKPEDNEGVRRFLGTLGEIAAREGEQLLWVLGIDMAHIGRRYGSENPAVAYQGELAHVMERDKQRIEQISAGNASGFWDLVQHNHDDLNWCGSSPLYTFLSAVPGICGELHRYEQWNIDDQSVVSFAGMSFHI